MNQDLYCERKLNWQPLVPQIMEYASNFGGPLDVDPTKPKTLPSEDDLNEYKNQDNSVGFAYVKLHGSLGWTDSGGSDAKVIGINKLDTLGKIPLLAWYFDLFRQAIYREGVRLLVVGYGFRDKHINNCLAEAVEKHKIQIFVISPGDVETFYRNLVGMPPQDSSRLWNPNQDGQRIWQGVSGYFPYRLSDVFPVPQVQTPGRREIERIFGKIM